MQPSQAVGGLRWEQVGLTAGLRLMGGGIPDSSGLSCAVAETVHGASRGPNRVSCPGAPAVEFACNTGADPEALVSLCDGLGAEQPLSIREKIGRGEFIDFNSLLSRKGSLGPFALVMGDAGQVCLKPDAGGQQGITSIEVWTDVFLVFASIFLGRHPHRALELIKYCSIVRRAAKSFGGLGWRVYDEQFRLRQAREPTRSWASIDAELWLTTLASARQPFRVGGFNKGVPNVRQGVCFAFNRGACNRRDCRFNHRCSRCNGFGHPGFRCRQDDGIKRGRMGLQAQGHLLP